MTDTPSPTVIQPHAHLMPNRRAFDGNKSVATRREYQAEKTALGAAARIGVA